MPTETFTKIQLLTPQETAELLGISKGTLNLWRCKKRYPLPYVKVGRAVRYRLEDVLKFIESRRQPGNGEGRG